MFDKQSVTLLKEKVYLGQEFFDSLQYNKFNFHPVPYGSTEAGHDLKLGFSCYGLKYNFMSGKWDSLGNNIKDNWISYLDSFQKSTIKYPDNLYIDESYLYYLNKFSLKKFTKNSIKSVINKSGLRSYENKEIFEKKSLNAETKQALATLYEVNHYNMKKIEQEFNSSESMRNYLVNLDWTFPWASGAQFASLCVYSATQELYDKQTLEKFIDGLVDRESGFYFSRLPKEKRELFNGAMKIISGLDWLGKEIHYPDKIIELCLSSKPIYEGCDIVDFVYILYKCTNQTSYKKKEVVALLKNLAVEMEKLYHPKFGGYSYFHSKSQTHYYGVEISKGKNYPDIHATLLCNWANVMILELIEANHEFKIFKP